VLHRLRTIAAIVAALAVVTGAAWALGWSDLFPYRTLRIVGAQRATEAEVRHLADLPMGVQLARLDLDRAAAGVRRHPWVLRADASRRFPDAVVIEIEERVAVAVLDVDGERFLVDTEGLPFVRASTRDLDLPWITGIGGKLAGVDAHVGQRAVTEALTLLADAGPRGRIATAAVSEVHFDAASGYTLVLANGGRVLLGFRGAPAFDHLRALASAGVDLAHPHRIDLGSPELAVVTPL
jgi:cell division protein FtsQ